MFSFEMLPVKAFAKRVKDATVLCSKNCFCNTKCRALAERDKGPIDNS